MKAKDAITSFSLKKNHKGKGEAWPWLGEYCATVTFRKDFTHPKIRVLEGTALPGLLADIKTALGEGNLKLHADSTFVNAELTVVPIETAGKKYGGFQLTMEIDGPTESQFNLLKLVVGFSILNYISGFARAALEKALDNR